MNVTSIALSPVTRQIWVGGWRHPAYSRASGLRRFRAGRIAEIPVGKAPNLPYVDAVTFDSQGNLWVAAEGVIYSFDGEEWSKFSLPTEAISEAIQAITVDRDGVLWCGTTENLWYYQQNWSRFSSEQTSVQALLATDNKIWVGTEKGLQRIALDDKSVWHEVSVLAQIPVTALVAESTDTLWIGTTVGLARLTGQEYKLFTAAQHGLSNNFIQSLALSDDYLWVGTVNGLSRFTLER